jgi:hypothetical protein
MNIFVIYPVDPPQASHPDLITFTILNENLHVNLITFTILVEGLMFFSVSFLCPISYFQTFFRILCFHTPPVCTLPLYCENKDSPV